jgi:hypothetical protein
MTLHDLATGLRARLLRKNLVDPALLAIQTDETVIVSYTTCSCCGERKVSEERLPAVIGEARGVKHFFALCDQEAARTASVARAKDILRRGLDQLARKGGTP